jgi:glutathione synthase/RimK-type ligase-like ATP-grasp enzyme
MLIVANPNDWPLQIEGIEVVSPRRYLTDASFMKPGIRVINLCRSYRYQSLGYYVSLLAAARGHRPVPDIITVRDLQEPGLTRAVAADLDQRVQRSLSRLQSDRFTLSVYFGRNLAKQYDQVSNQLFRVFHAPLLRADFKRTERWVLRSVRLIGVSDVPESHRPFLLEAAGAYFAGRRVRARKRRPTRFDLALLTDPADRTPPSNARALAKFMRAGEDVGIRVEQIDRDDLSRVAEFDGLFVRTTTSVNHYTYRFARRAQAEGLVVIDDPTSIVRCTNKVFLAELLARHQLPIPRTIVVHADNLNEAVQELGVPCILKRPDSSYSAGVVKANTADEFQQRARELLSSSDLIIAQEFMPTDYDWRVGVLDGQPLYVCKYYMAHRHWQVVNRADSGKIREGKVDTFRVEDAPRHVVRTAVRAANLIGRGLYGVDLKQLARSTRVIEVNDNPSIDAGCEDGALKDELYREIMGFFLRRMEARVQ